MGVSLAEFTATLKLTWGDPALEGEKVFSYWNNESVSSDSVNSEEALRIVRARNGEFRLEIANLLHKGTLEELEGILYAWALDEGWLD
jgi:hypothetical protein